MVDIHCHILPAMDDGAKDIRASMELCALAADNNMTLDELLAAGVVDEGQYTKLSRCLIAPAGADDAPE